MPNGPDMTSIIHKKVGIAAWQSRTPSGKWGVRPPPNVSVASGRFSRSQGPVRSRTRTGTSLWGSATWRRLFETESSATYTWARGALSKSRASATGPSEWLPKPQVISSEQGPTVEWGFLEEQTPQSLEIAGLSCRERGWLPSRSGKSFSSLKGPWTPRMIVLRSLVSPVSRLLYHDMCVSGKGWSLVSCGMRSL